MSHRKTLSQIFTIIAAAMFLAGFGSADAVAARPTAPHGKIPSALQNIESRSEDIIDLAAAGHWAQVSKSVNSISSSWAAYQPQAIRSGATPAMRHAFATCLDRLRTGSAARNPAQTMQTANNLSAVVVDLYSLYNPAVPTDVSRLDVLERQVILDMQNNNPQAAQRNLASIHQVWQRLQPSVKARNGATIAREFQNNLADQSRALQARNHSAVTSHARHALDLVDGLERLYG